MARSLVARMIGVVQALLTAVALAAPAAAQNTFTVQGRVYAADTGEGIRNAVVSMEGSGSTLTSASGAFRFQGVAPGVHALSVEAFGYENVSPALTVDADTTVDVPLTPAPLSLDSLNVELETLDFDGRVVDPQKDLRLVDAEVLSSQGHELRSDTHGNFDLDDVYQDVPLRIVIRSFGYLPLDTTFVPDGDGRHDFDMAVDSAMQRMIALQDRRLEQRSLGYRGVVQPMDREDLLGYAGRSTLLDVVESEYRSYIPRVRCVVVDEVQIRSLGDVDSLLMHLTPEEVERIEFLATFPHPDDPVMAQVFMMRVYTRDFIRDMVARGTQLRRPMFNTDARPPVCR